MHVNIFKIYTACIFFIHNTYAQYTHIYLFWMWLITINDHDHEHDHQVLNKPVVLMSAQVPGVHAPVC